MTHSSLTTLVLNGQVFSALTRALLIADIAGCVQLETPDGVLIKLTNPAHETSVYPMDLHAAIEMARSQTCEWLQIRDLSIAQVPENETYH
jgi:hypothetical protein